MTWFRKSNRRNVAVDGRHPGRRRRAGAAKNQDQGRPGRAHRAVLARFRRAAEGLLRRRRARREQQLPRRRVSHRAADHRQLDRRRLHHSRNCDPRR